MKKFTNHLSMGRASLSALSVVAAAAIIGGVLFTNTAVAQSAQAKASLTETTFGPVRFGPIIEDIRGVDGETAEVALLLPAVQKIREAASRVQVIGEGFSVDVPVFGKAQTSMAKVKIWTEPTTANNGFNLHIRDQYGNERVMPIQVNEIVIKVLPAVQSNRVVVQPEAASVRHNTMGNVVMGDGSVKGILIGLLLPAVQTIR